VVGMMMRLKGAGLTVWLCDRDKWQCDNQYLYPLQRMSITASRKQRDKLNNVVVQDQGQLFSSQCNTGKYSVNHYISQWKHENHPKIHTSKFSKILKLCTSVVYLYM
jgi:hypothetical protein